MADVYMHNETFEIVRDDYNDVSPDDYFPVDELIALTIQILNRKGYTTGSCCSCHGFEIYGIYKDEESNTKRFSPQRGIPYSSIGFSPEIHLPSLPPGFVKDDWDNGYYFLRRGFADTGDFDMLREIFKTMEQLYEWALGLPNFIVGTDKTELPRDNTLAELWYRKAAEQGLATAQLGLAWCYEEGKGAVQDYAKAVYWYTKAAEQGNINAQCDLGDCYEHGKGVTQDYAKTVYWYTKAAEQNDPYAQRYVGECYRDGKGVTQDYTQAEYWYKKSADQGIKDAREALEAMKAQLSQK